MLVHAHVQFEWKGNASYWPGGRKWPLSGDQGSFPKKACKFTVNQVSHARQAGSGSNSQAPEKARTLIAQQGDHTESVRTVEVEVKRTRGRGTGPKAESVGCESPGLIALYVSLCCSRTLFLVLSLCTQGEQRRRSISCETAEWRDTHRKASACTRW